MGSRTEVLDSEEEMLALESFFQTYDDRIQQNDEILEKALSLHRDSERMARDELRISIFSLMKRARMTSEAESQDLDSVQSMNPESSEVWPMDLVASTYVADKEYLWKVALEYPAMGIMREKLQMLSMEDPVIRKVQEGNNSFRALLFLHFEGMTAERAKFHRVQVEKFQGIRQDLFEVYVNSMNEAAQSPSYYKKLLKGDGTHENGLSDRLCDFLRSVVEMELTNNAARYVDFMLQSRTEKNG